MDLFNRWKPPTGTNLSNSVASTPRALVALWRQTLGACSRCDTTENTKGCC